MKRMGIIEWLIVIAIIAIIIGGLRQQTTAEETKENEISYIPMECTAYCYDTVRCDGGPARKGICAGASRYYGKTAIIYESEAESPVSSWDTSKYLIPEGITVSGMGHALTSISLQSASAFCGEGSRCLW